MESYTEQQTRIKEEQAGLTKQDVIEQSRAEYVADLDNLPRQKHNWVKRGIKISCEGANHPHHSHFLTGRPMKQT
jgi:hypothetical protein